MTRLDLSVHEELSNSFEPCLNKLSETSEELARADKSAPTDDQINLLICIIELAHGMNELEHFHDTI